MGEHPWWVGAPGAWSSSALGQAFSQILHQFAGQESRRGKARSAALEDLAALLEAKECDRLFEGSDASLRGMPEMLGQVAKALGKYAAPAEEPEGQAGALVSSAGPGRSPPSPHPPWAAPSLPEALGSALHGPHSHPHPAASPGLLGQGIPDRLRVCVDRASDRSEGLLGCPPGSCSSVAHSCLTLCDSMDYTVHGIL